MSIAIRGINSQIAKELLLLLPATEWYLDVPRGAPPATGILRHLYCAGFLAGKKMISGLEDLATFKVNTCDVINHCNKILDTNEFARICVIGSESGFSWSYDDAYAASKAALHRYVETKKLLSPEQQLVCIAPSIIGDAGMTLRRTDIDNLKERSDKHRKKRFLKSIEVARLVHFLLYVDRGYITNVVIRMNGGSHCGS